MAGGGREHSLDNLTGGQTRRHFPNTPLQLVARRADFNIVGLLDWRWCKWGPRLESGRSTDLTHTVSRCFLSDDVAVPLHLPRRQEGRRFRRLGRKVKPGLHSVHVAHQGIHHGLPLRQGRNQFTAGRNSVYVFRAGVVERLDALRVHGAPQSVRESLLPCIDLFRCLVFAKRCRRRLSEFARDLQRVPNVARLQTLFLEKRRQKIVAAWRGGKGRRTPRKCRADGSKACH